MQSKTLSVLIVDDHREIRGLLRSILERNYVVIGEADTGEVGLDLFKQLHPDVVVLDISMPGMNGFRTAQLMFDFCCKAQVVFCSDNSDPGYFRHALTLGALGYVLKSNIFRELMPTMAKATAGVWE